MRPQSVSGIETGKILRLSKKNRTPRSPVFSYSLISVVYCLFALIHTVQECNNLCSGTAAVRANRLLLIPLVMPLSTAHLTALCIICVHVYISEIAVAGSDICLGCARQERYAVCARTGLIRAEGGIGRTVGDAILDRPCNCLGIILVRGHIGKVAQRTRFRRTCRTPPRKVTICARVQAAFGANSVSLIPR